MYRGLAKLVGMDVLARAATFADELETLKANWDRYDFLFIHFKRADAAGEDGDFQAKIAALEEVDTYIEPLHALQAGRVHGGGRPLDAGADGGPSLAPGAVPVAREDVCAGGQQSRQFNEKTLRPGVARNISGERSALAGDGARRPADKVRSLTCAAYPIVAGNWKMNTMRPDAHRAGASASASARTASPASRRSCARRSSTCHDVRGAIEGSTIALGAQNTYWEEKGAFTGEVSVTQVAEVATHVIIGHSERRQYFGETDETVNKRLAPRSPRPDAHRLRRRDAASSARPATRRACWCARSAARWTASLSALV